MSKREETQDRNSTPEFVMDSVLFASAITSSLASIKIRVAVHIGTSGCSYAHWTNVLYPEALPSERRLEIYVRRFGTVELNASYTGGRPMRLLQTGVAVCRTTSCSP
jgi:hypothetical protein